MPPTFTVDGADLAYLDHPYNVTADNERAVEVPLALEFLTDRAGVPGVVLEVGNVLAHYPGAPPRFVVDLHERARGVLNVDVRTWQPPGPDGFGSIVAISTLEHVGWDQPDPDPGAAVAAIERLRSWLSPTGRLFVTVPIGYHPPLDARIADWPSSPGCCERLLVRTGPGLAWEQVAARSWEQAPAWRREAMLAAHPYDRAVPTATAVWVAEFDPITAGQPQEPSQGG